MTSSGRDSLTLLARLGPHLPYIRRYARALTGSQATGDKYVRVALEALAIGERTLPIDLSPRVALYHVFHAIWCSTGAQLEPSEDDLALADPAHRLLRIAPRSRQAFLLTALEGFTVSETAQILDTDFDEVEALIAEAQADIDAELATDVLIIEDEPVIAADIEALVRELGHTVSDIAATRREAVEAVARKIPGLVLADIQRASDRNRPFSSPSRSSRKRSRPRSARPFSSIRPRRASPPKLLDSGTPRPGGR
jgi:DNA-directed RNA polymerase specialized sigma24 family protein